MRYLPQILCSGGVVTDWTDGVSWPWNRLDPPPITKCRQCGLWFGTWRALISTMKRLGDAWCEKETVRPPQEESWIVYPSEEEVLGHLAMGDGHPRGPLILRLYAWRKWNNPVRQALPQDRTLSMIANLRELARLYVDESPDGLALRAELHRQLMEFDKARELALAARDSARDREAKHLADGILHLSATGQHQVACFRRGHLYIDGYPNVTWNGDSISVFDDSDFL